MQFTAAAFLSRRISILNLHRCKTFAGPFLDLCSVRTYGINHIAAFIPANPIDYSGISENVGIAGTVDIIIGDIGSAKITMSDESPITGRIVIGG